MNNYPTALRTLMLCLGSFFFQMSIAQSQTDSTAAASWPEHTQSTRYFFSPNGFGLKKGEGYYQNLFLFFNQAGIGISDHFSLGFGAAPFFFAENSPLPVWINPQVSFSSKERSFSLGAGAYLGLNFDRNAESLGAFYGIGSLGSRSRNISLGLGLGFADGDLAQRPAFILSGTWRFSRKSYLISENYLIDRSVQISFGGRTVWKYLSLDYGLIYSILGDYGTGLPWLGLMVPFGKRP